MLQLDHFSDLVRVRSKHFVQNLLGAAVDVDVNTVVAIVDVATARNKLMLLTSVISDKMSRSYHSKYMFDLFVTRPR